jgi:hypothetical protein
MGDINRPNQGRPVHTNAGIGQERVGEPGSAPKQRPKLAPAAGGPGSGSGDDATPTAENGPTAPAVVSPYARPQLRGH